jgi:hypothetical protein
MVWLVDEDGAVRPEYADDYVLAGALPWTEDQAAIDHERAFANLAPLQ